MFDRMRDTPMVDMREKRIVVNVELSLMKVVCLLEKLLTNGEIETSKKSDIQASD